MAAVLANNEIIARSNGWVYVGWTDCGCIENKRCEGGRISHFWSAYGKYIFKTPKSFHVAMTARLMDITQQLFLCCQRHISVMHRSQSQATYFQGFFIHEAFKIHIPL